MRGLAARALVCFITSRAHDRSLNKRHVQNQNVGDLEMKMRPSCMAGIGASKPFAQAWNRGSIAYGDPAKLPPLFRIRSGSLCLIDDRSLPNRQSVNHEIVQHVPHLPINRERSRARFKCLLTLAQMHQGAPARAIRGHHPG